MFYEVLFLNFSSHLFRRLSDLSIQTSGQGGLFFQGPWYASGYDPSVSLSLIQQPTLSMGSLRSDLLEEVKDVLIPAEMLRVVESQIIGKGELLSENG